MKGLMQDHQLTITHILDRMRRIYGDSEVVTLQSAEGEKTRATYAEVGERIDRLCGALGSLGVKPGDRVDKGQELGRSGATGLAIGDHLHYETLVNGISVTPMEWWDAKWIRDHVNLPLKAAGLPEIAGLDGASGDAGSNRARRRR
jgi:hypothetical protein